jgi:FkbM family methyltransferase
MNNILFPKKLNFICILLINKIFRKIDPFFSPFFSVSIKNFFYFFFLPKVKFNFEKKLSLYSVIENRRSHFFANRQRGYNLYRFGLIERGRFLYNSYCLHKIKFYKNDIVIDCGSNYGDLFIEISKYIKEKNFIAFEPGIKEYNCVKNNIKNGQVFNLALSNTNQTRVFYVSSRLADSSFIRPAKFDKKINIKGIKLDNFIKNSKIKNIKLLKLEAEGFEPEILNGAKSALKFIKYIAVDGSRERGIKKNETFSLVTNFLLKRNFKLIHFNGEAYRGLFLNKNFKFSLNK